MLGIYIVQGQLNDVEMSLLLFYFERNVLLFQTSFFSYGNSAQLSVNMYRCVVHYILKLSLTFL